MESADRIMHQLPLARTHDPLSSYEAAERVTKSGVRAQNKREVLKAVIAHPGCTSRELTAHCPLGRYEIAQRLPDLRDKDHAVYNPKDKGGIEIKRQCTVGRGSAITWRVERRGVVRV